MTPHWPGRRRERPATTPSADGARITLYGKPGCHLCDDARVVIERVCADLGVTYDEIDITEDPDLMRRYGEEIPVTLVDGRQHDFWRVDETRLRAAVAGGRRS